MFFNNKFVTYKLLAVDPGSNFTGVSLFEIDIPNKKILSIKSKSIDVNKLKNDTGLIEELHEDKIIRYYKLRNAFLRLLKEENIHYVAYEGPFMNRFRPNAFAPLVRVLTLIHDAAINYSQGMPFVILQPKSVKKYINVAGKKGKGVVKSAIESIPELMEGLRIGETDINNLDDNAIDSIAVGYAALKLDLFLEPI